MEISAILSWLNTAPQLSGEKLNWNYLPSYSGWSLTIPKAETRTDILGNLVYESIENELCSKYIEENEGHLKITRRYTIQSNEDRLRIAETLEDLAAWAKENPPEHTHLKVTGLPEFTSRNNSGIEDISITLMLTE